MKIKQIMHATMVTAFLLTSPAFSEELPAPIEHPVYRDGTLYIPRVDTEQQAGQYSDATLQFDSPSGMWKLVDFFNAFPPGEGTNRLLNPEKTEVIVTGSSPIQVFLKASVKFGDGCIRYGWINQRRTGNTFEIVMHRDHGIYPAAICAADPVTDEKVIPLQVYGLPAGTYEYIVNGQKTGTFTLSKGNTL
ncbi:MAG: hypothetical protein KGN35_04935 [Betaproteobacteria bacterium]|nr:hypothetical protein [Betaproteobacteria bacterium]